MTILDAQGQPMREAAAELDMAALREAIAFLRESGAWSRLELEIEQAGWQRENQGSGTQEPSRQTLRTTAELARLAWLKNPLIRRAVDLSASYVFAQGVSVKAPDKPVNKVIQAFWDDSQNQAELTGHIERAQKDRELTLDGDLFLVLFVNPSSGAVKVSTAPADQVERVITDPENAKRPWFYERRWSFEKFDETTGATTIEQGHAYYPDWRYRPAEGRRRAKIGDAPVRWDSPVMHVKVGGFSNWRRGFPEVEVARPYAATYRGFLEDWASIAKALSRFAWKYAGSKSGTETAAVKSATNTTLGVASGYGETRPSPLVGSLAVLPEGRNLEPIRTSGASISAEDGKQLRIMAISALGFADHMYGDTAQGTLATARSLDRPTELRIRDRQSMWANVYRSILGFVLLWAVKAPSGPLRGKAKLVPADPSTADLDTLLWPEGTDATINVDWPPIVEQNLAEYVEALAKASEKLPAELIATLLMVALEVDGIDEWMKKLPKPLAAVAPPVRQPGAAPEDDQTEDEPAVEAMMVEAVAELRKGLSAIRESLARLQEKQHVPAGA